MECKDFMEGFLRLDNGEALSPELEAHRKNCARAAGGKGCAAIAEKIARLMEARAGYGNIAPERDITPAVMARIAGADCFGENRADVSMRNWVCTGLLILVGMCLIPFSTILPDLVTDTPWLSVALPLVLGAVITIYAMLFTGSHMKSLSRLLRVRPAPDI